MILDTIDKITKDKYKVADILYVYNLMPKLTEDTLSMYNSLTFAKECFSKAITEEDKYAYNEAIERITCSMENIIDQIEDMYSIDLYFLIQ